MVRQILQLEPRDSVPLRRIEYLGNHALLLRELVEHGEDDASEQGGDLLARELAFDPALQNFACSGEEHVGQRERLGILDILSLVGLTADDRILATPLAVITGLTYNFLPFMILPLFASLDKLDPRLIEASNDLYASPVTTFRKVVWPLSLPGVVAGTLLTFIPASGDYINAQLLGSITTRMIGSAIQVNFIQFRDYPIASALSVMLMFIILIVVSIYIRRSGTEDLV